jgi:hypothetical protein
MTLLNRAALVSAAMVIGASTVFVINTPAFAALGYSHSLWHGDDVAAINTSNMAVTVCDQERDGNGVSGQFVTTSGAVTTVGDSTGSGIGRPRNCRVDHVPVPSVRG